jgi:hypothetical protein
LGPASSTSLVAPQSAVLWRQRGLVTSAIYAMRLLGGSLAVVAFGGGAMTGAGRLQGVAVVTLLAAIFAWVLAPPDAGALGEGVESTAWAENTEQASSRRLSAAFLRLASLLLLHLPQ